MLKLLAWNVLEGGSDATCGDRTALVRQVLAAERPDVAVLVEAGELGPGSAFGRAVGGAGLHGRVTSGAEPGFNVAVLAREPAEVVAFEELATEGPNPLAVAAVDVPTCGRLRVVGVHLHHEDAAARERQAWQVVGLGSAGLPTLVAGDLNGVSHEDAAKPGILSRLPPAHVHRHVDAAGRLATGATRLLADAGLVDAFRRCNGLEDPGLTVPTDVPQPRRFGPLRLDYLWLSPELGTRLADCRVVRSGEAPRASDHFPVVATLRDA